MPDINQTNIRQVFTDPNSFATTLVVCFMDIYGPDAFSWAPETIWRETEEDFGIQWPQANFDRLMTGIALVTTDNFYKNLPDFIELCNMLSGSPATPGVFAPADAADCAWGITEAILLSPPDEEESFTEEIRAYVGKVVEMEGILSPPDILRLSLLSGDHKIKVHNDFSDDPEMFNAIWSTEHAKTEDINDLVKGRLMLLVQQLGSLHLQHGSTGKIAQQMLTNLKSIPAGGTSLS